MTDDAALYPVFLKIAGRRVLVVGGGPVAASKLAALVAAGADVHVVAPEVVPEIAAAGATISRRAFAPPDLDDAWFVVAAATPEVNRAGGGCGGAAAPLRQRRGRSRQRLRVSRRRRPQGGRDAGHLHRRPGAGARRPAARGAGSGAARRPGAMARDGARHPAGVAARRRADARAAAAAAAGDQPPVRASPRRASITQEGRTSVRPQQPRRRSHDRHRPRLAGRRRAGRSGAADARALALLRHADLVLYDALVPDAIVALGEARRSGSPSASAPGGRRSARRRSTA